MSSNSNLLPLRRSSRIRNMRIRQEINENTDNSTDGRLPIQRRAMMFQSLLKGISGTLLFIIERSEFETQHLTQRMRIFQQLASFRRNQGERITSGATIEEIDINQPSTSRRITMSSTSTSFGETVEPGDQHSPSPARIVLAEDSADATANENETKQADEMNNEDIPENPEETIEPLDLSLSANLLRIATQDTGNWSTITPGNDCLTEQKADETCATCQFELSNETGTEWNNTGNLPCLTVPQLSWPSEANEQFVPFGGIPLSQTLISNNIPEITVDADDIVEPLDLSVASILRGVSRPLVDNSTDMPINYCIRDANTEDQEGAVNLSNRVYWAGFEPSWYNPQWQPRQ